MRSARRRQGKTIFYLLVSSIRRVLIVYVYPQDTGEGVIYTFNPMTGQPIGELTKLGYKVKQSMLLHISTDDFLRGIILLDTNDGVHVFPESAKPTAASVARNTYLFTADPETGVLQGYSLAYSTPEVRFT